MHVTFGQASCHGFRCTQSAASVCWGGRSQRRGDWLGLLGSHQYLDHIVGRPTGGCADGYDESLVLSEVAAGLCWYVLFNRGFKIKVGRAHNRSAVICTQPKF